MKHTIAFGPKNSFVLVIGLNRDDLLDLNNGSIPCLTAHYGDSRIALTVLLEDSQKRIDDMVLQQVGLVRDETDLDAYDGHGDKEPTHS